MSNLKLYQWMTTTAKKVGGAGAFMALIGVGGYVILRSTEVVLTSALKSKLEQYRSRRESRSDTVPTYEVDVDVKIEDIDLELHKGDKYRILESDDSAIMIEVIGDENNPYVVHVDFLRAISNFDE